MAFSARGITDKTQVQVSNLNIIVKPQFEQLAYAGYSKSIEAFLYATAIGTKVSTTARNFPLQINPDPELPIPNPAIAFKLASTKPSPAFTTSFDKSVNTLGGKKTLSGKTTIYTIPNCPPKALNAFAKVASENFVFIENHATIEAAQAYITLKGYVDLFLRTHLYECQREEGFPSAEGRLEVWNTNKRAGTKVSLDGTAYTNKRMKMSDGVMHGGWLDKEEKPESSWEVHHGSLIHQSVLIAKPSNEPSSSINYGDPHSVPNKPGFFFPYFPGMLSPDAPNMRELAHTLFFRLLPVDETGSPQQAWKEMRLALMSLANTPEGMILHHILKGCEMALTGQARLFLVFGDREYKGFCLLGECLTIYVANMEYVALSSNALRAELAKVPTRAVAAKALVEAIDKLTLVEGEENDFDPDDAADVFAVADILAKVDLEKSDEEAVKETQDALKLMAFRSEYRNYSPSTISRAIDDLLLHQLGQSPTERVPFYIPLRDWSGIDDPIFQILARFGSTSFSFISASKGEWIRIPDTLTADASVSTVFAEQEDPSHKVYFYDKPVEKAVRDWKELLLRGAVRYDTSERAGSIKATSFSGSARMPIVQSLLSLRAKKVLEDNMGGASTSARAIAKDKKKAVDFESEFVLDF